MGQFSWDESLHNDFLTIIGQLGVIAAEFQQPGGVIEAGKLPCVLDHAAGEGGRLQFLGDSMKRLVSRLGNGQENEHNRQECENGVADKHAAQWEELDGAEESGRND